MDTTTTSVHLDRQDRSKAAVDTVPRPPVTVTSAPERLVSARSERRLPAWGWFALSLLVAVVIAVISTALHARTALPTSATTPGAASRLAVDGDASGAFGHDYLLHRRVGTLVDGNGVPVTITGSVAITPTSRPHRHLPGAHVISRVTDVAHALGFVAGRASM